jgi:hypothetical protein
MAKSRGRDRPKSKLKGKIKPIYSAPKPFEEEDSILKTVTLWWLGNIVFGLIPLLVVGLINIFNISEKANELTEEDMHHIINDGAINFFCLAIIGAIAVDIYSSRRRFTKHRFVSLMKWAAIGVGIIVAFVYIAFVLTKEPGSNFGDKTPLTIALVVSSLIYCTIGKINLILIEPKTS